METWANLDAARHGGGNAWVPGSYDPETHLYIFGTGNPSPAYTTETRGEGDNLYTCSVVAINVETGKMAWYYQTSPHDTHDWDSAQTPVLVDARVQRPPAQDGAARQPQRLLLHAGSPHGRTSGDWQVREAANWAKGINAKGQPVRDPAKDFHAGGALVSPAQSGRVPTGRLRRSIPTPA